ncbi:MAG: cryptochrome/photolyase family protein [Flavobacteriia bacterium]|jgi:deoxyribodipyrimidine photo-lyase
MKTLFWHRRDLRIEDNSGLYYALKNSDCVQAIFIFDSEILNKLEKNDQRVLFIYREIEKLKQKYKDLGSDLHVFYGNPVEIIPLLCDENQINTLCTNKDYEPYAIQRDKTIFDILKAKGVDFIAKKDHVIFEKNEILKGDGSPYTIFTPYSRRWKEKLNDFYLKSYPTEKYLSNLAKKTTESELISLQKMGFESKQVVDFPATEFNSKIISEYSEKRDIPSLNATSRLSLHLRFGTISIRKLTQKALETNQTYLNELIWRDFYQAILYHFPHSATDSFKKQYDRIEWKNKEKLFELWCEGKTGYPLVDAGMRELNTTGFMHNRVRMVVASFLCKHLLIDWRWGERYFAEKLLDFDLASNTGGWQWASGSGCDAAPYFRVFNPQLQQEKFDKDFKYIKKWVPEFGTEQYPEPIVEHKVARDLAIASYKLALTD